MGWSCRKTRDVTRTIQWVLEWGGRAERLVTSLGLFSGYCNGVVMSKLRN